MARRAAKITHDEVTRLVKAVCACKLPVQRVTFDGVKVDVIIGEPDAAPLDTDGKEKPPVEVDHL